MKKIINDEKSRLKLKINSIFARYFNKIITIFLILIIVAGYFFLIRSRYKEITTEAESNSESKEVELSEKRNSLNKIKKLKEAYQQISREDSDKIEAI